MIHDTLTHVRVSFIHDTLTHVRVSWVYRAWQDVERVVLGKEHGEDVGVVCAAKAKAEVAQAGGKEQAQVPPGRRLYWAENVHR